MFKSPFSKITKDELKYYITALASAETAYYKINNQEPPDVLYHYTNSTGLSGLIEKNGIFASPYFSVNDPLEMTYALDILEAGLIGIRQRSKEPKIQKICDLLLSNEVLSTKQLNFEHSGFLIVSLSAERDNLSQWRSYAADGMGYSVGLNSGLLSGLSVDDEGRNSNYELLQCIYSESEQKKMVSEFITMIFKNYDYYMQLPEEKLSFILLLGFEYLSICFKHPAYKDEKEWRLKVPFQTIPLSDFSTYNNGKTIKASLLLKFLDFTILNSITMGPRQNFKCSEFGLRVLVEKSKLADKKIEIVASEAPYR